MYAVEPQFRLTSTLGLAGLPSVAHACKGQRGGVPFRPPHGAAVKRRLRRGLPGPLAPGRVPPLFLTPSVLTYTHPSTRVSQSSVGHVPAKFSDPKEGVVDPLTYRWSEAQVTTWPCNRGLRCRWLEGIPQVPAGAGSPGSLLRERGSLNWVQGPKRGQRKGRWLSHATMPPV